MPCTRMFELIRTVQRTVRLWFMIIRYAVTSLELKCCSNSVKAATKMLKYS